MEFLAEKIIRCPYCDESLDVLIDPQEIGQQYVEDCQVCCKPITFHITTDSAGNVAVSVHDENDIY